jgi:nitrogen fixation protein NifB
MADQVRVAEVAGKKVQWDAAQMRKILEHPCFSEFWMDMKIPFSRI